MISKSIKHIMKGNHVVAERFIRTLKNKIYKYVTLVSKYVYTDNLDNISYKCIKTYHSTIKMKPVDAMSSTYINFGIANNKKDPEFKVGDHVRISIKYLFKRLRCKYVWKGFCD